MDYLVKSANLIDTSNGAVITQDIAISDGRVVEASQVHEPTVIDGSGKWLLFGMWDCHAHPGGLMYDPTARGYFERPADWAVRAGANLMNGLSWGVTGVRAVAESDGVDLAWSKAFERGAYAGPRVKSAGAGLRTTGGHGTAWPRRSLDVHWEWPVDGADEMRRAARRLVEQGVDWIKLMLTGGLYSEHETVEDCQFTDDELAAVMEVANNRGIPVAAHCGSARTAEQFAALGGRSIEHGYALDEKAADAMAKHGVWLVPTISVTHDFDMMAADNWPPHAMNRAKEAATRHRDSLLACLNAGVKIAVGADLNPIGPRIERELMLLESCGMTRLQVIHAATSGGRELNGLGAETLPVPGSHADLLLVSKNPLEDLSALSKPELVFTFGRLHTPSRDAFNTAVL